MNIHYIRFIEDNSINYCRKCYDGPGSICECMNKYSVYNFIVNIRNNEEEAIIIFIVATEYYKLEKIKNYYNRDNTLINNSKKLESKKKYIHNTGKLLYEKLKIKVSDCYLHP